MPKRILIVGNHDLSRSPMLVAFLRNELKKKGVLDDFTVESAGVNDDPVCVGIRANPNAIQVMALNNLVITGHLSRTLDNVELTTYDRIYCLNVSLVPALRQRAVPGHKIIPLSEDEAGTSLTGRKRLSDFLQVASLLSREARSIVSAISHDLSAQF